MPDVVRIQDQLEYGREYLNNIITSFYNTSSNSVPLINGILKVEYDPILQLGRLKAIVNGEVKTFSFTDPVPSNFLFYSPEDDKIVSAKIFKLDNIEVDTLKEKNLDEGITLESKLIAQDIDAQTITAKNLIIEETINKSIVEYLEIEDKDIILHSGFEGNYENNILGNSRVVVNRGSLDDVYTIWDEIKNRWGITNDGTNVIDLIGINSSGKIRDNLLKEIEFLYNSENNTTPGIFIDRGNISKSTVSFNWNETQEKFNFTDATGNKSLVGLNYITKEFDTESNILKLKQYENKLEPSIVFDRGYTTSDNATISWDNDVKRFKVVDEYETFYLTKTMGASQEYTVPYTYVSTLGGETSLEIPDTYFVLTDYVFQDSNDKYIIFKNSNLLRKNIDYTITENIINFIIPLIQEDVLTIYSGLIFTIYEINEDALSYNHDLAGNVVGNPIGNMTIFAKRGNSLPAKFGWDNVNEYWYIDNATGSKIQINPSNIFQTGKNYIASGVETTISLTDLITTSDFDIDGLQIDIFKNGMLLYENEDYTINKELNRVVFPSPLNNNDKIRILIGRLLNTTFSKNDIKEYIIRYNSSHYYEENSTLYYDRINLPFEIRPGQNSIKVYVNGKLKNNLIDYFELSPTQLKFFSNFSDDDIITIYLSLHSEAIKISQKLLSFDTSHFENVDNNSAANCAISVYRGNGLHNAEIKWNEINNNWQITNGDGTYWNLSSEQNSKVNSKRYIATGLENNIVSISDIINPSASIFSIFIYKNGLALINDIDYTFNNTSKYISFNSALSENDILYIIVNYNLQDRNIVNLRNLASIKENIEVLEVKNSFDIPVNLVPYKDNLTVFVNGILQIEGIGKQYIINDNKIIFTNNLDINDIISLLTAEQFNSGYIESNIFEVYPDNKDWYLKVNRNSDMAAYFRWNENINRWVYSNGNGLEKEFGGSASASAFEVLIPNHNFSVLDAVRYDSISGNWVKAISDIEDNVATHIVINIIQDLLTIASIGRIDITDHGLQVGEYYFVSDEIEGGLTNIEPKISNPALFVENENVVHILTYLRALDISEKDFYTNSKFTGTFEVNTDNSLFNHIGNGHQLKINKNNESDTSSILFQEDYVSFAEIGLVQNNNFSIKVKGLEESFVTALEINSETGVISMPLSTATDEEVIEGINSSKIITPSSLKSLFNYANPIQTQANIFGVQATNQTETDGAGLQHVDLYGQPITLTIDQINAHPAYGISGSFVDTTDASDNVFCTIPIAYWWRGYIDGKWTLLISDKAGTYGGKTFTASDATFKKNESYRDAFYIGKYRGSDDGTGTKVASKQGAAHWGNVTFDNFRTYCSNNGTDYHMLSLFEWHEILSRMVVEKCTFQLMPEATRAVQASCVYRGINDFAYGPTSDVYGEFIDGIRTDASGNFEIWSTADGNYISTNKNCIVYSSESNYYCQSLYSEMDNLFISATNGTNATSFIPDLIGMRRTSGHVSKVCCVSFSSSYADHGAFAANFDSSSANARTAIGCRLAK